MQQPSDLRVLVLAPRGRDGSVAAMILGRAGMATRVCEDLEQLIQLITMGAGAALLTEEALTRADIDRLRLSVASQPAWSDLPFIVLARSRDMPMREVNAPAWLEGLRNAVLLERPLGSAALTSAVRAALRARCRQYEARAHLVEREAAARELEALNASLEKRVADRTAELRTAYERLQSEVRERQQAEALLAQAQRLEALGQLAGGIAHDFNNVLQAVSGGLGMIRRRAADPEAVRRLTDMAIEAAKRGVSVTGRLLAFGRRSALRAEPVLPVPLLQGLREMLDHTLGANIVLEVDADPELPPLLADRGQLETVLVNLAVNARDAMPQGGVLHLSATSERVEWDTAREVGLTPGRYLRLAVRDTGTGMDAATLIRVGEPFFTTKALGKGTGLGLAMARGFARQSGGALVLESAVGRGTTVAVWLPETAERPATQVAQPDISVERARPAARILLVDDDNMVRDVLRGQLEDEGYVIVGAASGLQALAWLEGGEKADLLISDFAMPGMNGMELIQETRRRHLNLPSILLTGYADKSVRLAFDEVERRTVTLLRKPVSGAALAEHVATLLSVCGHPRSNGANLS